MKKMLYIVCPNCGTKYQYQGTYLGRRIECAKCKQKFNIDENVIVQGYCQESESEDQGNNEVSQRRTDSVADALNALKFDSYSEKQGDGKKVCSEIVQYDVRQDAPYNVIRIFSVWSYALYIIGLLLAYVAIGQINNHPLWNGHVWGLADICVPAIVCFFGIALTYIGSKCLIAFFAYGEILNSISQNIAEVNKQMNVVQDIAKKLRVVKDGLEDEKSAS